jgi:alanine racemase
MKAVQDRIGGGPAICVPLKADAYGHGALRIARAALDAGARYLAVARVQEGAELREGGIVAPILLLSLPLPEELPQVIFHRLIPLIPDKEFADEAAAAAERAGKKLPVHLKIDSGMGRIGCRPDDAADLALYIRRRKSLEYEGTATHLAAADSAAGDDIRYTKLQLARFREALASITAAGVDPGIVHAANSGAVVFHGDACFDMVRPGIALYGYSPGEKTGQALPVTPVMEVLTHISSIKEVKKGEPVSYGRTWTAPRDTLIAVIPIGYGDGLPRALSGRYSVGIRNAAYPLVGRICMDQSMVDLGPEGGIERWEEVRVFGGASYSGDMPEGSVDSGAAGAVTGSAADIASILGTIPYEITGNINKRVERVYVGP